MPLKAEDPDFDRLINPIFFSIKFSFCLAKPMFSLDIQSFTLSYEESPVFNSDICIDLSPL